MKPTIEILANLNENSKKNKEEVFTRLYRYMLREDIYYEAYRRLYSNRGASTKGIDDDTADGFSELKVRRIIESLKNETYKPKPSKRTYILKSNGKKRPLGIPTFTDKLIQEVLRMILEAIYEPIFLNCSHGFRPKRSCHTALKGIKKHFNGIKWFVEGDIKGCFDNIDHSVLIGFINKKIKDARLIKLLYKFLKAGYMEDWKYNKTYSGTPQGGIVSPLLANIYLHELDKFVMKLKEEFDKPSKEIYTKEYNILKKQNEAIRRKLRKSTKENREELLSELKKVRAIQLKTPYKSQTDKSIEYIRYCDDFIIGIKGNKEDANWIKMKLKEYISEILKMELSEEKTLITYSNEKARFLGYNLRVRRDYTIKPSGKGYTKRTLHNIVEVSIPFVDKIERFLFDKKIVIKKNSSLYPVHRKGLVNLTDLEILATYNSELRGICNYYNQSSNFYKLNYFSYLMEYSCLKTIASKHKMSMSKIRNKYKDGKGKWCIPYETKKGIKYMYFVNYMDCKKTTKVDDTKSNKLAISLTTVTSFEDRLKAHKCELCGDTESSHYEVHHINKLKNLKGKKDWEKVMISKNRKTMVVCRKCHHKIHNNQI
ncbi:MAG: group II intron reverse transcriptase/maturase [Clostridiales bacterium]|nr:group II intron reverse transcriptase/maturase [Clostridiales bacterium]